jgi:hypothetical protein
MQIKGIQVEKKVGAGYTLAGTRLPVLVGTGKQLFLMQEGASSAVVIGCTDLKEAAEISGMKKGVKINKATVVAMSGGEPADMPEDETADEEEIDDDEDDHDPKSKRKNEGYEENGDDENEEEIDDDDEDDLEEALTSDFKSELQHYFKSGRSRGERGKFAPHSPRLRNFLGLPPAGTAPAPAAPSAPSK